MSKLRRCGKELDKDTLLQSTEEQCCPVCQRPLSMPPLVKPSHIKGKKLGLMRFDLKQLASSQQHKEGELIISAMCGHLFHKFCLRHYCYTYRQGGSNMNEKVECPVCFQSISMIKIQTIDYMVHRFQTSGYEKVYRHTLILNKELSDQKELAYKRLAEFENSVEEAIKKMDTYRSHESSLEQKSERIKLAKIEYEKMCGEISESTRAIDMMHKENMQLITMYLSIMKDKPYEELRNKRVPAPLIPYLAIIQGNEKLMGKFGEILKPIEIDGMRSNAEMLMQQILADVQPKALEQQQRKTMHVANLPNHFKVKRNQANPVVVKVQNSCLSVFSRTVLTEDSLHHIMKHVKAPIKALKDAHKKHNNISDAVQAHRSASEIKVLFGPRKRQTESDTTPMRVTYEDSDCEFGGKELMPVRRCRSTEPILMKNYIKGKGAKTLIVKMDYLKQDEMVGVEGGSERENYKLKEFSSRGDNEYDDRHASVPSTPRNTPVNKVPNSAQHLQIREQIRTPCPNSSKSRTLHKNQLLVEQHGDVDVRVTSSVGFSTTEKASVLEVLFENIIEEDKSNLVDEVAKITFGKGKRSSFNFDDTESEPIEGVMEYKMDKEGRVIPSKEEKMLNLKMNMMKEDIESEIKLNECRPQSRFGNESSSGQQYEDETSGILKGLLPGPFRNPARSPRMFKPENDKLPVYLSNWVSKLPSARGGNLNYVTPRPGFPPPPPVSNKSYLHTPPGAVPTILPPLPMTPPPRMKAYEHSSYEKNKTQFYNREPQNWSYEDNINESNTHYSCPRYTVVEIPSSRGCLYQSQSRNPIYSKTHLPPLPNENIYSNDRVYTVSKPKELATRRNQRPLVQPPPIHIVVQPKFSSSGMTQQRPSTIMLNEPLQLHLSQSSQERMMQKPDYNNNNNNNPTYSRDLYSTEGPMQRNYNYFPNEEIAAHYTTTRPFEGNFSQFCNGLSPPDSTEPFKKNDLIYRPEGHPFGPNTFHQPQLDQRNIYTWTSQSYPNEDSQTVLASMQPRVVRRARRRHNLNV